MSLNAIYVEKN